MTDHLLAELLQPDRLRATLSSLWTLRAEKAAQVDGREAALRGELARTEEKLKRLYQMVEKGATDLDDIPKGRLQALKQERDRARAALAAEIAPKLIERFGPLMRTTVTRGEIPFRKAWRQAIVDRAEVEADAIRIIGDKASLEAAIIGGASSATPGVRSSVRKRRTRHDSNV